ncbi:hypothetical protein N658DRAFT_57189 [Parathielavia hyrcaniae]|uniref:Uncharacterized protein n=1 Tax=Parathielavia hyrcaniae TaxID=113614 RepID=A0AAN6SWY6_9PEZI|nr:hypothetical protein N658DRAFT_57189 [Parathielavia hyrcaniae]
MMPSMHQTCTAHLAPLDLTQQNPDLLNDRSSYRESLVRYLQTLSLNTESDFHPLLLVRAVARIVASEWIVTNAQVERDINTIEWQLETMSAAAAADVGVLQKVLSRLFTHRRRIAKYRALVEEQGGLFREQGGGSAGNNTMPAAWLPRRLPRAARRALRDMQTDADKAHDLVTRNAERVAQLVELLMSVMSVREAGLSVRQNETLTFLALVATFALPFLGTTFYMADREILFHRSRPTSPLVCDLNLRGSRAAGRPTPGHAFISGCTQSAAIEDK